MSLARTATRALRVGSTRLTAARTLSRRYTAPSAASRAGLALKSKHVHEEHSHDLVTSTDLPRCTPGEKEIFVHWDGSQFSRFHNLWLRDHCRCSKCFHPVTKQRLVPTFEIPSDIQPASVTAKPEGLEIIWQPASAPHTSVYPWSWLQYNTYDPAPEPKQSEKVLWGSKIAQSPPTVAYDEVMASETGLYKWLSNIDKFGFCFVSGVPPNPEATEELSTRIGFIRTTHYGGFWDFTADLARGDTAYTNLALPAHTDNTYFTDPCGLQIFHLLQHDGKGGQTLLVDGFYVAGLLKELNPTAYEQLSTQEVTAHAAGEEDILYKAKAPVLTHDAKGELAKVRWNNDDRSVVRGVSGSDMLAWYDAMREWNKGLTSADAEYWVKLTPGTVVAIDNHRVLHGRAAFDGTRRMCGAYIGVDEFRSKLGVLGEKFAPKLTAQEGEGKRDIWSAEF
ncbi:Trimethyllysine dioxygenase [Peniophora sp. CONT]|nr:Trimethyllysine dioxygenase [Peniophora sp. CONT]